MVDRKTISIYYTKRFTRDEPSDALKNFMSLLPSGARVLDWGCGPAASSYHLQEAGFIPDSIDASSEMVTLAKRKYGLKARCGTFDDDLHEESYDGAWVNFSLLHARRDDLPKHIEQLYKALIPNGILYLGMKIGKGEGRDRLGRFYTYYETTELTKILKMAGFEIINTHEGESAGLAGSVEPFVLITSKKV